jgi:hypothetical protein
MKHPTPQDFAAPEVGEAQVTIVFNPSNSHYTFNRLADPEDIAVHGPLSGGHVRHAGPTRDTGDYPESEVEAMAHKLASAAVTAQRAA